jgi:hypothetical protein
MFDSLLMQVVEVVRQSDAPITTKLQTLVRAGRIGEMYLGPLADVDAATTLLLPQVASPVEQPHPIHLGE